MSITLVYDGGCLFCNNFALLCELKGGIPDLQIKDGRADNALRHDLKKRGMDLANGAVLIDGDNAWYGSDAIAVISEKLDPSSNLLKVLMLVFHDKKRSRRLYPALLFARRLALAIRNLPIDPDANH